MLILTVTRQCNLRCSYCATVKDGFPSLAPQDCRRAIELYARRFGGGDIKLFGGEPLLAPEATRASIEAAQAEPGITRIYLSTNGLGLDESWVELVRRTPKLILTISIDGRPEDHERYRRPKQGKGRSYAHVMSLLPLLIDAPRVVVTQTIPPAAAPRAADNLEHLYGLGFWRFNLLPGYFLPWSETQLAALRESFTRISQWIEARWKDGERFYLRNLFTWAPTTFFNRGMVVDVDRSIHPSNIGLWGGFDHLAAKTQVGDLDHPPTPEALENRGTEVNAMLQASLSPRIWDSTMAVDAELARLCEGLYPALVRRRRRVRGAA